jgi:flagellar motor protein MotB
MRSLREHINSEEESFGPGIDLIFSIFAILLVVLALVFQLYRQSSIKSLYFKDELVKNIDKNKDNNLEINSEKLRYQYLLAMLQKEADSEKSYDEQLRTQFGQLITEAAVMLEKVKENLETENFPITIEHRPDKLYFDMGVHFRSSSADPSDIGKDQIRRIKKVGDAFREILDQKIVFNSNTVQVNSIMRIIVEGHTDDQKPDNDNYVNYHFSTDRALTVMKILMENSELTPPKYKVSIAGYAEYGREPTYEKNVRYNQDEKRSKMRRVTISIAPDYDVLLKNQ